MNLFASSDTTNTIKRTIHLSKVEAAVFSGAKAIYGDTADNEREYVAHSKASVTPEADFHSLPPEMREFPPKIVSIVQGKQIKSSYLRTEVGDEKDGNHKETLFVIAHSARYVRAAFQEAGFNETELPEIETHLRSREKRGKERVDSPTVKITPPPRKDGIWKRMMRTFK